MKDLRRVLLFIAAGLLLATAHAQPTIIQQPASGTVAAGVGAVATFSVHATGAGALAYQWLKVGTNMTNGVFPGRATVTGAITNTLTLTAVTTNDESVYSCRVTDTSGSVTSSTAILTTIVPPLFTIQPITRITNAGSNVTFTSVANGTTPLGYLWSKNGTNIGGATLNTFTINNAQTGDSGNFYSVTASNSAGVANSTNAFLYVGITPAITVQPTNLTVVQGQSATFTVGATGSPLNYYWRKNGVTIPGATNSSLTFASAVASNGGFNYSCLVSNFLSIGVPSAPALLTVQYPPTITTNPVGQAIRVGSNFSLTVSASGVPPPAYQWRLNGTQIAGATATIYSVIGAQTNQAGNYDVVVTNSQGSATSTVATVNVGYPPVVTQQPQSPPTNSLGGSANFSCVVTGTTPISLQWTLNGYPIAGETNATLALTNLLATNIGFYALTATNLFGSAISSNAQVNLTGYNFSQWAGLEAWFPLNGDATDASGNGNHGTNFGAVAATDRFGNINGAMSFNGTSAYVRCKSGAYFSSNYTVSAWVNATAYNNNSRILDFGNGGPLNNTDLILSIGTTGHPDFDAWIGTIEVGICPCTNAIPSNQWVYVVATCSATNTSIYFNAILQRLVIGSINRPFTNTIFNYLGKSNFSGDSFYAGRFDDIRIFNRALSSNEVAQLYALESQTTLIPPQNLSATLNGGSNLNFKLTGQPGSNYVLQTATNLAAPIQWQSLATNTADINGTCPFTDSNLNTARKFYRATTP